ncbi:MAG: gamma-glutamyl-gamma-aminobutyrate hydrolase family protein [Clostridia bacterium]|nr:gamma-glutamyl-gamma-aminobutyrate hydrolase family protein [Clostridia bacterium]
MSVIIGIIGTPFETTKEIRLGFEGQTTGTRTTYENAILKAGGTPIILCPNNDESVVNAQLKLVGGLLMQGGGGEEIEGVHLNYIYKALKKDIPILGICMGMQLINVALDGKLDIIKNGTSHTQTTPLYMPYHNVIIEPKSILFNLFNDKIKTNSHHKYGISELGKNIISSAKSEDDVIEAIEVVDKKFVLGVQWHPEHLVKFNNKWLKLFETFINACK